MKTLLLFFTVGFLFAGCGLGDATDKATKVANEFNQLIVDGKYDKLPAYLDESIISQYSKEQIDQLFQYVEDAGRMTSYKKGMGFNTQMNNGVTTVDLNYTLKGEGTTLQEDIQLVERGGTYKISSVHFQ